MPSTKLQRLWIPGPLPCLNDIIDDSRRTFKSRRKDGKSAIASVYSKSKKAWTQSIVVQAKKQGFQRITGPACYTFVCYELHKRRDPDNFTAGAKKLIFDALQASGLLENDGWKHVLGIAAFWEARPTLPGVTLFVAPGCLSKEAAFLMEKQHERRKEARAAR